MRGEVLHYDEAQGFGFISGADGNRYTFRREDMRRDAALNKGIVVEFEASGGQAKGVFPIHSAVPVVPVVSSTQAAVPPSSQHFGRYASAEAGPGSMGLWSYFWRCLTVNYASFRPRARRKEYWSYILFWLIGFMVLGFAGVAVDNSIGGFDLSQELPIATIVLMTVFVLGTIVPGLAVTVRRIHDIGLSGWFYLLVLIPYVGSLIVFVFSLIPSQAHHNKWGPVPDGIAIPTPYAPPAMPPAA